MTSYITITDTETDPSAPLTAELAKKWRDNPIAIAEGSTGAPYAQSGWHPYDGVTIGDGADGVFYDFTVDGAVSSVETPNFVDGYEYQIYYNGLTVSSGAPTLGLQFYREVVAAYSATHTVGISGGLSTSTPVGGSLFLVSPRLTSRVFRFEDYGGVQFQTNDSPSSYFMGLLGLRHTVAQKILKAKLFPSSSTFSGGKIFMMKRRCYVPA